MSQFIPAVIRPDGRVGELQAGEYLRDYDSSIVRTFTSTALLGQIVYADTNTSVDLARGDVSGTSEVLGMCVQATTAPAAGAILLAGIIALTTGQWDAVTGETGGLVLDQLYYLSLVAAGMIVIVTPAEAGKYCVLLGKGISTTEMKLDIQERILRG